MCEIKHQGNIVLHQDHPININLIFSFPCAFEFLAICNFVRNLKEFMVSFFLKVNWNQFLRLEYPIYLETQKEGLVNDTRNFVVHTMRSKSILNNNAFDILQCERNTNKQCESPCWSRDL